MTDIRFFPRDRTFWWYHGLALLAITAVQTLAFFIWREHAWFNLASKLVWLPLFTLAILAFRYLYLRRQWHQLNMGRLILVSLICTLLIGFFVTLGVLAIVLPSFWSSLVTPEDLVDPDFSISRILVRLQIGNTLNTQVFACAWIFLYLSVTTRRRTREMEMRNLKLANSLKEAQITNLTNQLNPHFLFNSLNNIRFVIHENAERADHTITALSEILRYSLESGRRDKVTLGEEMAMVGRYLEVMALQLEDRLQFDCAISEALDTCLLPPMSLQLLVENAIKHGIEKLREGGVLTLDARANGEQLVITLKNSRSHSPVATARNTGTGLDNLRRRLQLLYGSRAGLDTVNAENRFSVTLTLPREEQL